MFTNPFEIAILSIILGGLGTLVWWGIRRLVDGQGHLGAQLSKLDIAVAKICGNLEMVSQWQILHEDKDELRQSANTNELSRTREAIEKLQDNQLEDRAGRLSERERDRKDRQDREDREDRAERSDRADRGSGVGHR